MKNIAYLLLLLGFSQAGLGQEMLRPIAPRFKPDPIVLEGSTDNSMPLAEIVKGKVTKGNCNGYGSAQPTYVLTLSNNFAYLNLKAKGEGIILLVQGPDGIYCRQGNPEIAGMWTAGSYQIWIGTQQKNRVRFRVTLSETDQ